jgi:flagellum-specific ATP synthase
MFSDFSALESEILRTKTHSRFGFVDELGGGSVKIRGLGSFARIGDQVVIDRRGMDLLEGEIVALSARHAIIMTYGECDGVSLKACAQLRRATGLRPDIGWMGRIVDSIGRPMDGLPLREGGSLVPLRRSPPDAAFRKPLGSIVRTGVAAMDTMLPLARGQRIGLFAGSGVGKSSLLADLARGVDADVVVLALIGERGRELRHFTDHVLGPEGMSRSVIVTETSDRSPLEKRRAAWSAMAIAEFFRDLGMHVLFLVDSVTRFAEAHREVALTAGEAPSLRAFPPSTSNMIAGLVERAGPGASGQGDITAVFSVLVAGSDLDEPVADITRGVLDGHIVLDREIAERGRFPAIDVRRSVSRSLPDVLPHEQNLLVIQARRLLSAYEMAAPMIRTGLYAAGSDPEIDMAIRVWPKLDQFFARSTREGDDPFAELSEILGHVQEG